MTDTCHQLAMSAQIKLDTYKLCNPSELILSLITMYTKYVNALIITDRVATVMIFLFLFSCQYRG